MPGAIKEPEVGQIHILRAKQSLTWEFQIYWTKPTVYCPNSKLPVLVYRNVLPEDLTAESARQLVEANNWDYGGTFKHYPTPHFHSNTHECYAALKGHTKCLYGVGPLDDEKDGVKFEMKAGDIAVHAAGVTHRNTESSSNYEYMGLYRTWCPTSTGSTFALYPHCLKHLLTPFSTTI